MEKDGNSPHRRRDVIQDKYEEALSSIEKEFAESGLSEEEIKSLESVIYRRADDILEKAAAVPKRDAGEATPERGSAHERKPAIGGDIPGRSQRSLVSKGQEEIHMEKPSLRAGEKIYDLTEVFEESPVGRSENLGGGAEGTPSPGKNKVYELSNLFDDRQDDRLREDIMKKAAEIAERVAREVVPAIAERVIREEIEKLKGSKG